MLAVAARMLSSRLLFPLRPPAQSTPQVVAEIPSRRVANAACGAGTQAQHPPHLAAVPSGPSQSERFQLLRANRLWTRPASRSAAR